MDELWRYDRFKLRTAFILVAVFVFHLNFSQCLSLNSEGSALLRFREGIVVDPFAALSSWNCDGGSELDHCSWFGVECRDGEVVILNLKDLCLEGTLAPELGTLTHLKSINLRNNSFRGNIPREILDLKELEMLDLGYNNLSGSLPSNLGNNLSLSILLLDNNELLRIPGELFELKTLSEFQVDENQLTGSASGVNCNTRYNSQQEAVPQRGLLQISNNDRGSSAGSPSPLGAPASSISFPPSSSPTESPSLSPSPSPSPVPSPTPLNQPIDNSQSPQTGPVSTTNPTVSNDSPGSRNHTVTIWTSAVGGSLSIFILALGLFYWRRKKVVTISPWATGLSGQLRKAFITGVPKLQRSELVTACEDFSNIIGNISDGTVYKGTLSSGVEIAVTSTSVKAASDWTKNLEAQFRHKIDTLSKVNHKNFVNLIGFCEEEQPFTRMMVFEYAPNGTLFEHLHIKEAEHLDWRMRLRIAMGMAYCLEYMHQLNPPISHANLQSSSVYLTEDYAAKLSDFTFWNESKPSKMHSSLDTLPSDPETNVYSFGVILFEMITGRIPYSVGDDGSRSDWAANYLNGDRFKNMVDSTLTFFDQEDVAKLFDVVRGCVCSDPKHRMKMRDVVVKLKEITDMGPDGATPKVSPLWWAELEILSTES